jgi:hypothetical protein
MANDSFTAGFSVNNTNHSDVQCSRISFLIFHQLHPATGEIFTVLQQLLSSLGLPAGKYESANNEEERTKPMVSLIGKL